jgi:hypothetical protein
MAKKFNLIGSWAFLAGVVIAVIAGIIFGLNPTSNLLNGENQVLTITLVIIGLVVGLLNVTNKESTAFLLSGISLIIASVFGAGITSSIPAISFILSFLLLIFVPATIIVAIRNVFSLAKN